MWPRIIWQKGKRHGDGDRRHHLHQFIVAEDGSAEQAAADDAGEGHQRHQDQGDAGTDREGAAKRVQHPTDQGRRACRVIDE
jgi:hypothetical protein